MVGVASLLLRRALAVVAAAVLGLLALIGVAALAARPTLFLLAGLGVFVAASAAGVALVTRRLPDGRRGRTRLVALVAGVPAAVAVFWATALAPVGDPRLPPAPVEGQRFWELPTGSRIAWVHLPAPGPRPRPTPVVFLHGGPGVADMAGDAAYFGQLTRDGFDVWVYDQVGTGRSSRLPDPRQYTIARNVADLEAIRQRIGADRMVLIGHSWGAQVAAAYLAAHPDRVARVVFSSPGALAPALDDGSDAGVRDRLTTGQRLGLYRLLLRPRVLLAWTLLQVNPEAAHTFAGDAEMDARNDRVYNHSRPALHCHGASPGPALHGLGFYAHQSPSRPPPARGPTRGPGWPACRRRRWSSRGPATTCPGPRPPPTGRPCPTPNSSTSGTPATTATRTSPPPTWPASAPSSPAGPCPSPPGPGPASRPASRAPRVGRWHPDVAEEAR
jgi:proline iminopeptidase